MELNISNKILKSCPSIKPNSLNKTCMLIGKLKSMVKSTYKPIDIRWKRTSSPQTLPWTIWLKLSLAKQEAGRASIQARIWLLFFPDRDPSKSSKIAAWGNGNATKFGEFINFSWLVFTVNPPINWKTERPLHRAQNTIITNDSWIHWNVFSTLYCVCTQLRCPWLFIQGKKSWVFAVCWALWCVLGTWRETRAGLALPSCSLILGQWISARVGLPSRRHLAMFGTMVGSHPQKQHSINCVGKEQVLLSTCGRTTLFAVFLSPCLPAIHQYGCWSSCPDLLIPRPPSLKCNNWVYTGPQYICYYISVSCIL